MSVVIVVFCVCALSIPYVSSLKENDVGQTNKEVSLYRDPKFWWIGLVQFENAICTSLDGLLGTCYRRGQCSSISGIGSGSCANGIGVCCISEVTCGNTTQHNNTYFVNPNYPSTYNGGTSCSIIVKRCDATICQLRIDFLSLTLAQPDGNGYCIYDSLTVTGGAGTVPVICGENSGQHIYVNFNGDNDIVIRIDTTAALAFARSWTLQIAQIGCACPTKAPAGCLMYYTELSGTVTSFNYGSTVSGALITDTETGTTYPGTRELANLNYGVCIAMAPGYCSIQWSQSSGDVYSFTVTNSTIGLSVDPGLPADSIIGENCTTDFVVIPNPYYSNGTAVLGDRFCGNEFPTVTTSSKPFVLTVVTNANEDNDIGNRGFSLSYTQQMCTTSRLRLTALSAG